ncbi:enoyl-CoA hydratase-related protein [Acinetobacter bereziniae]|uniref:enoyl-CoA hydratase-related protein n=1 Tax=Acinetobacter bereziniae TaxID=106648 RepID=UPI00111742F0|nr:enoyl-CoA hydratase-related protein [Acinetobacter bereziniae]MCU4536059.1 enoyl-CoA hydratase/isomerase family protein [Acinetobacter bereziniae]NUF63324.1 enoyl-CoA hydratase/isomerase family protein [Acinetobacter bereziniae]NUG06700.1 enoyl-CoA hydratase/isomerase family protein [Acinetobacter bereziniae]NUG64783.1 enoyl-CoA hydratase/isomerase family protein [Acinetobacter bereziniae]NUG70167.1 enoyl-CoA hydratase/isomerase family protein [Acinetobacter bereziniae]
MDFLKTSLVKTGVMLIELNRPEKHNALNNATLKQLVEVLQDLERDQRIKTVVITGNETCFAAGADLKELAALDVVTIQQDQRPLLWKHIDEFSKPIIMAINGFAFGAGFELALHGDIVLTGENAQFALPEIGLGMLPGAGGTQRLARLVGQQLAMRWAMTGERISAALALQHGISSQICPSALTVQYAIELAEKIAKQAPLAIRVIKQSLKSIHEVTLSQGLKQERQHFVWLTATQDRKEGIDAFFEKRKPEFRGV